ncbi:MAG: I78 family peptidase inhibitor [Pseudomonadota bacterium]
MPKTLTALCACVTLVACNNAAPAPPDPPRPPAAIPNASSYDAECDETAARGYIGKPATQDNGKAIQSATGSMIFQWVLVGQPVTDDYRPNRVRVMYDDAGSISVIRCG